MKVDANTELSALWFAADNAMRSGDLAEASRLWHRCLELDPHCADAWLGLFALEADRQYLEEIVAAPESFGALQSEHGQKIEASYRPGISTVVDIVDLGDVHRALALSDRSRADQLLSEVDDQSRTDLTRARLAFDSRQFNEVIAILDGLKIQDLQADIEFMLGAALVAIDFPGPGGQLLEQALATGLDNSTAGLALRYLDQAYGEGPEVFIESGPARSEDPVWDQVVASFYTEPAEEPS
jgi:hypothetical protein